VFKNEPGLKTLKESLADGGFTFAGDSQPTLSTVMLRRRQLFKEETNDG